jgi:hypothetical protein
MFLKYKRCSIGIFYVVDFSLTFSKNESPNCIGWKLINRVRSSKKFSWSFLTWFQITEFIRQKRKSLIICLLIAVLRLLNELWYSQEIKDTKRKTPLFVPAFNQFYVLRLRAVLLAGVYQNQKYKKPFWSTFSSTQCSKMVIWFRTYQLIVPALNLKT